MYYFKRINSTTEFANKKIEIKANSVFYLIFKNTAQSKKPLTHKST